MEERKKMKMKINKRPIVENLKNWYAIDSILLNEHANRSFVNGKDYKQYLALKAALLSNLYEFHQHVGFSPKSKGYSSDKVLQEAAVVTAKDGKALAATMIQRPEFKNHIKEFIVRESVKRPGVNKSEFSKKVISERFMRMALDNVLIGIPLLESVHPEKAKDFEGEILEEAYRMMRTSLIHHVKNSPMLTENQKKT